MSIYTHIKSAVPLNFRVWARRDVPLHLHRLGARLKGSGPIPPADLIVSVIGVNNVRGFLEGGETSAEAIRDTLKEAGADIESFGRILDFGCGAGRIMRHWRGLRGPELHGTDYNPALVEWCAEHLTFARFKVNPLTGPLPYEDESFDLIYAYSVFTHLSESLQRYWMGEMRRVLRPGGLLYVTLHGEAYARALGGEQRAEFAAGRFVAVEGEQSGTNYCAAYHPEQYVRGEFSEGFTVEVFRAEGAKGGSSQDAYLLRRART